MKLELVPVPVSDIDRAKLFYADKLRFHVDHDVRPGESVRVVQLSPPGSACSILLGEGLPAVEMPPRVQLHSTGDAGRVVDCWPQGCNTGDLH